MVVLCVAAEHGGLIRNERKKEKKESSWVKLKAFPTNVWRNNYQCMFMCPYLSISSHIYVHLCMRVFIHHVYSCLIRSARAVTVAPPGHRVRVDFSGEFDIEKSDDCAYDYIEMRDGLYGFSPLLGRYCGHRHPGTVKSTGRAIWIAFKTDNSVEYTGFQAAFYFFAGKLLELLSLSFRFLPCPLHPFIKRNIIRCF